MASLSQHKGASPDQVLKRLQNSKRSKRCTGSAGLFGPQQPQVPEPRLPRPRSCAVMYLPPSPARGSADTQAHTGEQWALLGTRALLPPVPTPAQAGAVPVSLAFWLHWVALLLGREQPGDLCEDCPCHSALFPHDMMGDVPCLFMEPVLGVLCSVHLEVQYKGKICLPTVGGVG